jgi:hypothetical protein
MEDFMGIPLIEDWSDIDGGIMKWYLERDPDIEGFRKLRYKCGCWFIHKIKRGVLMESIHGSRWPFCKSSDHNESEIVETEEVFIARLA